MLRFSFWTHWAIFPRAMRRAAALATLIVVAASAMLYQTNVRSDRPPAFGRGGAFAGSLTKPGTVGDLSIPTADPNGSPGKTRSEAVLRAPATGGSTNLGPGGIPFPTFAKYIYGVDGYEQATAFGRRDYPGEMSTTVHRTQPTDPAVPRLRDDELIFDLFFSDSHEEREIVAFRDDGIVFTYEAGSVTFGFTQTSEATYTPPMLQIPVPLSEGAQHTGTSEAKDNSGNTARIEDWTVTVLPREDIEILGETISAFVVRIDRRSRPGSNEQVTRSRTYWFDPERVLWVKWEEQFTGSQDFGPGRFNYSTRFTATLKRIEPL